MPGLNSSTSNRNDERGPILKQGILTLRRGLLTLKKAIQVTLCRPSSLADVQHIFEELFLFDKDIPWAVGQGSVSATDRSLDGRAMAYLGQLGWAAAQRMSFIRVLLRTHAGHDV
jgi:hypothetical protein